MEKLQNDIFKLEFMYHKSVFGVDLSIRFERHIFKKEMMHEIFTFRLDKEYINYGSKCFSHIISNGDTIKEIKRLKLYMETHFHSEETDYIVEDIEENNSSQGYIETAIERDILLGGYIWNKQPQKQFFKDPSKDDIDASKNLAFLEQCFTQYIIYKPN